MKAQEVLKLVVIGKGCYIPLSPSLNDITLNQTNIRIPAGTVTQFGSQFKLLHVGSFKHPECINDDTQADLLEVETKKETLCRFIEILQEKCRLRGADYVLMLDEFKIEKGMSCWVIKGMYQFLVTIIQTSS